MKTSLKRLVAGASIVALVAMNALTSVWANANPTFTYGDWVDLTANTADDVVTVTLPDALVTNNTADKMTVVITDANGAVIDPTDKVAVWTNSSIANSTSSVTITKTGAWNATFTFTPWVAGNFGISVVGTAGVGSAVASVWNANVVKVSAIVIPTLSMKLSWTTLDLGVLDTTWKASSIQLDVSTNANGGATTIMKSNWLVDATNNKIIWVNAIAWTTAPTLTTWNDSYKYAISSSAVADIADLNAVTTVAWVWIDDLWTVAATDMPVNADTVWVTVADLNKPGTTTKHVAIGSVIAVDTEAWNYSDTLTFTVTGSF